MTQPTGGMRARRGSLVLGLFLGIVTGIVVLGVVWALLASTTRGVPAPAPTRTPAASVTRTPTPSRTPSGTPSATPSVSASPSATVSVSAAAGGAVTQLPSGTLYTVLYSLPKSTTTIEAALAKAAEVSVGKVHPAIVLDSDAYSVFRPGYWAVGVPGATNRDESVAICVEYGIPRGNLCYSREIP